MILSELLQLFNKPKFNGNVKLDEPMKNHTTMRVGGIAPIYLEPEDEHSFVFAVKTLSKKNIKYFILGGGSNIVVSDYIDFAIISTKRFQKINFSKTKGRAKGLFSLAMKYLHETTIKEDSKIRYINCDSGANWGRICNSCVEKKLSGFESFSGLPGTVGGAIFINATCFDFSACDNLISVRYLDLEDFKIKEYKKNDDDWGYKKSPFQTNKKIVLSAEFKLMLMEDKTETEIKNDYRKALKERALKKHFESPSAGSVFKNIYDKGIIAGKIIDECGLKGTMIGGAKVADWHGNFIINEDHATAQDVKELVNFIKTKVYQEKNINLECEIIFIPENVDI